ncbi:MAG: hypothetical protein HQL67_05735 [Magnetococcales bacterium]|nr:hypothetical protein [Magnetococcales bacterium]
MFIVRLLLLAGIFYLIYRIAWPFFKNSTLEGEEKPVLVQCGRCQTWVPKQEILQQGNGALCCQECARDDGL